MSVQGVVQLVVVVLVASLLLPTAIDALLGIDTAGWPDTLQTIFTFTPIVVGIVFIIGLVTFIRGRGRRDD